MKGVNLWTSSDGYWLDSKDGYKRVSLRFGRNCCVVYTDMFLDDLCALEELSSRYDVAYIITVNEEEIDGNAYCSDKIHNIRDFQSQLMKWFQCVVLTTDTIAENDDDVSACDCYCLANATKIVTDLEAGVRFGTITAMIGRDEEFHNNDDEWNASQDLLSYEKLVKNYGITRVSHNRCVELYNQRKYGDKSYEFMDEYIRKMNAIHDEIYCFDLQAVLP